MHRFLREPPECRQKFAPQNREGKTRPRSKSVPPELVWFEYPKNTNLSIIHIQRHVCSENSSLRLWKCPPWPQPNKSPAAATCSIISSRVSRLLSRWKAATSCSPHMPFSPVSSYHVAPSVIGPLVEISLKAFGGIPAQSGHAQDEGNFLCLGIRSPGVADDGVIVAFQWIYFERTLSLLGA
ncbi:hypothetical protein BKA93DRAFT_260506 [Sparassis latifolia]